MTIDFTDIVIVAGNYGSGKTETAVNLAASCRKMGKSVAVADLDLVNPYFRTREARIPLEAMGIRMVLPDRQYLHADYPSWHQPLQTFSETGGCDHSGCRRG